MTLGVLNGLGDVRERTDFENPLFAGLLIQGTLPCQHTGWLAYPANVTPAKAVS